MISNNSLSKSMCVSYLQSSNMSHDGRLTVVRLSFDCRSKLLKLVTVLALLLTVGVGNAWGTDIAKWGKVSISANTNVTASGGDANNNGVAKFQSSKAMTSAGGSSSNCYYGSSAGGAVINFTNLNLSTYSSIQMTFYSRASQSGNLTLQASADGTNWVTVGSASLSTSESKKTISGIPFFATYLRLTHDKSSGSLYFGTVVISGTSAASKTITWSVNGTPTTAGSPTSSVPAGEKVWKFPTAPTTSDCDGSKVFVGWTATAIVGTTDTKPSDLFIDWATAPSVTANTTYYAVFANQTDFTRVTSTGDLADGQLIVVADDQNSKVLTTTPGYTTAPTETSSKITPSANMIWTLEASSTNWKLKTGTLYLGASATGNGTAVSLTSTNSTWTIGKSSSGTNNFYLKNTNGTNLCLEYYSSGSKWTVYANAGYSSSTYFTERLYVATRSGYVTSCCTKLGSINGSISLSKGKSLFRTFI